MALYQQLQELVMSGVKWELSEETPTSNNSVVIPQNAHRTPTMVVPPIAPLISMSVETATAMAARPVDMESMMRMIAEFNHPLRAGATNVVLPHIAQNPNGLVCITDIPASDDDACGKILCGATGELMDKMLNAIGMSRENVSIIPLLFWRTPGGRTPTSDELALSRPFVDRIIEMLTPRLILTLGTIAAQEIGNINLAKSHGIVTNDNSLVPVMPIYHPNYLILKPAAKRAAWDALQQVQNLLKTN